MIRKKIIFIWLTILSPFIFVFSLVSLASFEFFGPLPTFDQLENPQNNLATEIISSDSVVIGKYFFENRTSAVREDIPQQFINALLSTEDIRYRDHSGIDVRALFRAVYGVFSGKGQSGGASTITQQLAKMLFTKQPASGLDRVKQKLKEWVISAKLERRYTKDEILLMYLNRYDWVNNAVGIESASRVYFNKSPKNLNIQESAMLVGMLKNSALYNPNRRLKLTQRRRNTVLFQMNKYEFISDTLYDSLVQLPIVLDFKKASHNSGLAPYFREYLRGEMKKWCSAKIKSDGSSYNLYTDGLKIYTTIDSRLQKFAEEAVETHISDLQKVFYNHWEGYANAPFPEDFEPEQIDEIIDMAMRRSVRYKRLKSQGKTIDQIRKVFNTKVEMKLFSWNGKRDTILSPRDSLVYSKYFLHSGLMSMQPKTGHVKAYVGGINYENFQYDHVTSGKRQVGSTFKPFLYSLAIQEGYDPCFQVPNVPVVFDKYKWRLEKDWTPKNSGSEELEGLTLSLKYGLANSINTVTAYIMKQFGPHAVVDLAKKIGVKSKILAVPSLCLGTFDLSVYEMVGAYSTFSNKGVWVEPIFVTRIEDKNGVVLERFIPESNEAMSEETADIMVRLLQGVVDGVYSPAAKKRSGTGVRLRYKYGFKNEIGGKTGTTQNQSDGWFMGITPDLVTGVWTGCDDRSVHFRDIVYGQGANMALPIFAEFMQRVYADTANSKVYPLDFDISRSVDVKLDCDDAVISIEEEF
ncbi:transglycosylase domain-containing protein [Flavobacteriales bacterium]|nr:transglycosylase domain-containing protein [Flavobacteriales bacterium]